MVTAVNGYIASHIANQLLAAGYNVRGTVRDLQKSAWIQPFFAHRYKGKEVTIELVEITDFTRPENFNHALQGVAGVVHTCTSITVGAMNAIEDIEHNTRTAVALLDAASQHPNVKRFVFTSSSWAAAWPALDANATITPASWNEAAILKANELGADGVTIFSAAKVVAEKAVWKHAKDSKLIVNTVLPAVVFGPILNSRDQDVASSARMIETLFDGEDAAVLSMVAPQYFVDVRDVARLHVAALLHPDYTGERIFAYADRFNWNDILGCLRQIRSEKSYAKDGVLGRDRTEVEIQRSLDLLSEVYGQQDWTNLQDCVKATVNSFPP